MPALRIQMHLDGNLSVLQGDVVDERLVYIVHGVILRLQQKRRRRLPGDMSTDIRIQLEFFVVNPQMAWINSHRKIRAAAFFVGRIDSRVNTLLKMRSLTHPLTPRAQKANSPRLVGFNLS